MPQQFGTTPGQSESELQRMTPAEMRHWPGSSHVVEMPTVDTQQTSPGMHCAVELHSSETPMSQL